LEALPFITQSAQAIFGDKPYRIGPSTIAMRQNPYGGATKDNPDGQRIAMANRDPRHAGQFAAAWAIGYAARVASAGLEMLTPSSFAGPFGLLASLGEPAKDGAPRPLFHAVKMLCDLVGHQHVPTAVSDDTRVAALASRSSMGETIVCLANLTAGEVQVDISGLGKASLIMRNGSERAISLDAGGRLAMPPYAIARIG
ncbi:MAG: hypothetical protein E5V40_15065, partial [Mesorhizobium sp.]